MWGSLRPSAPWRCGDLISTPRSLYTRSLESPNLPDVTELTQQGSLETQQAILRIFLLLMARRKRSQVDVLYFDDALHSNAPHYASLRHYVDVGLSLVPISNTDTLSATSFGLASASFVYLFPLQMPSISEWDTYR